MTHNPPPAAAGRAGKGPGSLCGQLPLTAAAGKAAGAGSCPAPAAPAGILSPAGSGDSPGWVTFAPAADKGQGLSTKTLLTPLVSVVSSWGAPLFMCAGARLQLGTHRPQNGSCVPGESLQELHM